MTQIICKAQMGSRWGLVPSKLSQENPSDCRIPTVKKRSGSGMTCGYMSAKGVGEMTFIDGTTAACGYTKQKNQT